jgi:hypothetical protein
LEQIAFSGSAALCGQALGGLMARLPGAPDIGKGPGPYAAEKAAARPLPSKAQILDRVWSYDFGGRSNIVELYISYLRRKIDSGREPMIHTLRGAGYVLKPAS